eukprot:1511445-Rhodomonas_salina.3
MAQHRSRRVTNSLRSQISLLRANQLPRVTTLLLLIHCTQHPSIRDQQGASARPGSGLRVWVVDGAKQSWTSIAALVRAKTRGKSVWESTAPSQR